jgi:alpha-galactosidase
MNRKKIALLGAGSSVFAKKVLGDILCTPELSCCDIALYDIDGTRLQESYDMMCNINKNINASKAGIYKYLGPAQRREALKGADFVLNTIQVGGYKPCTVTDFEIPRKYGIEQTIADTLGIGGIMRALRTIPVMRDFAGEIEELCPGALFLNYTNPMAILSGYMQRVTKVKTVGLCHSVQVCAQELLEPLGFDCAGIRWKIAGINHMAWLLGISDKDGKDLYPAVKKAAFARKDKHSDMVRYEYLRRLGYYVTESSEHNAEYNPWFIKKGRPELIEAYNIPIDEYLRRCVKNIEQWEHDKKELIGNDAVTHEKSNEYASEIIRAVVTNVPYKFNGNVINNGLITNLPAEACVEVPCIADGSGIQPIAVGRLPVQCAAMNMTNINVQLLTVEAAVTGEKQYVYQAAMLDPRAGAVLSLDEIYAMVDELIEAHGDWLPEFH